LWVRAKCWLAFLSLDNLAICFLAGVVCWLIQLPLFSSVLCASQPGDMFCVSKQAVVTSQDEDFCQQVLISGVFNSLVLGNFHGRMLSWQTALLTLPSQCALLDLCLLCPTEVG
jgi:hypothetical protein